MNPKIPELVDNFNIQSNEESIPQRASHYEAKGNIHSIEKRNDNTIFISIAAYRDKDCVNTILDCFQNAKYPQNIRIGICQQNKDDDMDCIYNQHYDKLTPYLHQIKVIRIPYYEARGPTFARYWCSTLWEGEAYYMQIDSHIRFEKDWDEKCISTVQRFNKKVVLSTYPQEIGKGSKDAVTVICNAFYSETEQVLSFPGAGIYSKPKQPVETAFIAAGFFFADSSFLKDIPFDPHLKDIFVGEEILLSIRFWTHGWDIYAPNDNIVYHHYIREGEPKVWNDRYMDGTLAMKKVKKLIGFSNENIPNELNFKLDVYGLGNKRTLNQFYDFIGYDMQKKKCNKDFCKNIH